MNPDFKFDNRKARHALALGELERAVLETLWDKGELSGKDIFDLLGQPRNIRHNTILTVLDRLVRKGLVLRRKLGRDNSYKPKISRDEYIDKVASPIISELMDISGDVTLAAFVEKARRDPRQLSALKKLIRKAELNQKKEKKEK